MGAIRQPSLSSPRQNTGVALFISLVLLLLLTIIGVTTTTPRAISQR